MKAIKPNEMHTVKRILSFIKNARKWGGINKKF